MTDHEPDKRLLCYTYVLGMLLGLAIFAVGVWVGHML